MSRNTFGHIFKLTTFGESHGIAIGGIVDGCPAGLELNIEFIQQQLDRRKPGQSKITTQRKESDTVEILSGVFDGISTGTPIGFIIKNDDQKTKDYEHNKDFFRPSHADYTYQAKYGIRDYRGGGRSSARETASRVVGGAIAQLFLKQFNISFNAYVSQVGEIKLLKPYQELDLDSTYSNDVRCPDKQLADVMFNFIDKIRKEGDTIGGIISCVIKNVPVGLGAPVFDRLEADLAKAMLSINASKGFEIGSGFSCVSKKGSEHNDEFYIENNNVRTKTNNSGGVLGGISNGEDIFFNVAFKPIATILQKQQTVDIHLNQSEISGKGRHDSCVLPRAVPIVEAMASLVIADHLLLNRVVKL